jgi:hypothetical protein
MGIPGKFTSRGASSDSSFSISFSRPENIRASRSSQPSSAAADLAIKRRKAHKTNHPRPKPVNLLRFLVITVFQKVLRSKSCARDHGHSGKNGTMNLRPPGTQAFSNVFQLRGVAEGALIKRSD